MGLSDKLDDDTIVIHLRVNGGVWPSFTSSTYLTILVFIPTMPKLKTGDRIDFCFSGKGFWHNALTNAFTLQVGYWKRNNELLVFSSAVTSFRNKIDV